MYRRVGANVYLFTCKWPKWICTFKVYRYFISLKPSLWGFGIASTSIFSCSFGFNRKKSFMEWESLWFSKWCKDGNAPLQSKSRSRQLPFQPIRHRDSNRFFLKTNLILSSIFEAVLCCITVHISTKVPLVYNWPEIRRFLTGRHNLQLKAHRLVN